MKKNYLYVLLVFLFIGNIYSQTTETFETETAGNKTFTDNNQPFTITTQKGGSFGIVDYTGKGWNGLAADNKFIDNTGTADFGAPVEFTISSGGVKFTLKSLSLYLSTVQLSNPLGNCTITGKLNGTTIFTATKNNGFINPKSANTNNGYTKIDLSNYTSTDYSNTVIDQFVISTTGNLEYVALDAMNWKAECSYLDAPTATSPQAFCGSGTIANLTATGNNLKWYTDNTNTTPLDATTALSTKTYYVSQTDLSCESPRKAVVVTVTPNTAKTTVISECDEYTWAENNIKYTQSGTYISTKGCDTQTLTLTITPKTAKTTVVSECDEYTWAENNIKYTQSGTYTSTKGCDTQTLTLTITPKTAKTTVVSECDEYTWAENNIKYTQSGTYTSTKGCDTQTLTLTITPKTAKTTVISECDEYTWAENNIKYTQSGTYTSTKGCDTQTLTLTITPKTAKTTVVSECDEYTWAENNIKYTQSGTYTSTKGCDTQTLTLTITPKTAKTTVVSECDEYTWVENNIKYTQSGTYTSTKGCDTQTLTLTITPKTAKTTVVSECDEYTWAENNIKYTQSGIYTSTRGCDTQTLTLTITPKTAKTTVVSECDEYTWVENNIKYTQSGTYTSTKGCDTQTLTLTITPKTAKTTVVSECDEYTWAENGQTYSVSGIYTVSTANCVTEILDLTISSIDKSLKFENGILSSNTPNATYQWTNCTTNTLLSGATNATFTPIANGTYSVTISLGNCFKTSDCFTITTLGRDQFNFEPQLKVYPNPSHDVFNITIESDATVEVFDISGKKLKTQKISTNNSKLDAGNYPAGIYVLKITNENNQTKIVKVTKY